MVVVCESCSTRFQLDEARIPPKGTLVRCSRCKATFIVRPPSVSFEETVQDVVAEVSEAGGEPVPEPAEDLFDRTPDDLGETHRRPAEDDAWEFDEGPVEKPPSPALAIPAPPEAVTQPAAPAEELGSPEDWDLLGDSVEAAASAATFVEPVATFVEPEQAPQVAKAERERAPAPVQRRAEPAPAALRQHGAVRVLAQAGRAALRTTAWLALAGASAVALANVVPRGPALLAPEAKGEAVGLPDGEARGVHVRFVENAFAGTLYVVQGELARGSANPALGLRVHFVDAAGTRLGDGEWARPLPSTRELRERAPEVLRADPAAQAAPAPQQGTFAAIFDAIPAEANGVELALEPLPAEQPTEPPAPVSATPAGAPPSEATAAEATASSPPASRPSSE